MCNVISMKNIIAFFIGGFFVIGFCSAGLNFTNFGYDISNPVFLKNKEIRIYKNKTDVKPILVLDDTYFASVEPFARLSSSCTIVASPDGWVECKLDPVKGWVKYSDFIVAQEYSPVESWPFRYWAFVGHSVSGSEEGDDILRAVTKVDYLVKPVQFDTAIYLVYFDQEGFAISPKATKKTGERIFLVGNMVFLAPVNPKVRKSKDWKFMGYYNAELQALCPAVHKGSCYSAVNVNPNWRGIKNFYSEPETEFAYDRVRETTLKRTWFGRGEIAFARHTDPVAPLLYYVPEYTRMAIDGNSVTDAQMKKNREKPFCLLDCKGVENQIKFNGKTVP